MSAILLEREVGITAPASEFIPVSASPEARPEKAGSIDGEPEYIPAREARRLLDNPSDHVWLRLARSGVFGTRRFLGGYPLYRRADILAFLAQSTRPAERVG